MQKLGDTKKKSSKPRNRSSQKGRDSADTVVEIQKHEQQIISTATDDPMVGKIIGEKFRILGKHGSGGLSDVYRACDLDGARNVALKILRITQETSRQSFEVFTANARSTLAHPNFVTTIATGVTEEGEPWVAQEWLDCKTLTDLLAVEGTLAPRTLLPIFDQIGDAMNYAHGQGEVHMNLKPSNILLVERDGKPFIKICDFGFAKMLMERELEMADEKSPARGSTLYMSPEQFKGTRIDSRSDIYALGYILYQCMFGRPPHEGVDMLETMDRHMNSEVNFPSEPEVSEPVQAVLKRMLEKESTSRYRSMSEVMTDLRNALAGQMPKVEVRPEPTVLLDSRGVDFITAKRGSGGRKGKEPWMLLMTCLTVLLFVVIFQQCMIMVQEMHKPHAPKPRHSILE
jgi:serine/threonine protein kinase